jgi:hypothetical protein
MSKKKPLIPKPNPNKRKKDEVVKTSLSFEELMKKALNTPLPKENKKASRAK